MDLQSRYSIKNIINARGTFTPLGVSRSSDHVANTTAQALRQYFDIDELQALAGEIIACHCGSEYATITHCASAAITLSIAATMSGTDPKKIARLPDTDGMNDKVVIAAAHLINYGHAIEQDIRLAGCTPIIAGNNASCTIEDINTALDQPGITALLYVESRLVSGDVPNLKSTISAAHSKNIPVIVDGAAQDMRMSELATTGADLLIFSAHKYLAAPTAGIVIGKRRYVDAVHAQIKGIGRPMKAGKEAILGTIAAIEERGEADMLCWSRNKHQQAKNFADNLGKLANITTALAKDPSNGEFWRINLMIDELAAGISARDMAGQLQQGDPAIYCNEAKADAGMLNFEILELEKYECAIIIERISLLLNQVKNTR